MRPFTATSTDTLIAAGPPTGALADRCRELLGAKIGPAPEWNTPYDGLRAWAFALTSDHPNACPVADAWRAVKQALCDEPWTTGAAYLAACADFDRLVGAEALRLAAHYDTVGLPGGDYQRCDDDSIPAPVCV